MYFIITETKPGPRPTVDNRNDRNRISSFSENREERNNRRNKEEKTFNGSAEGNRLRYACCRVVYLSVC